MLLRAITNYIPTSHSQLLSRFIPGKSPTEFLEQMTGWLAQLPNDHPVARADMLTRRIASLRKEVLNPDVQLRMLEMIRASGEENIQQLEDMLDHATLPHTPEQLRASRSLDRLLKQLGDSYFELAEKIPRKWWRLGSKNLVQLAAVRAARMIYRRANAAYRIYATPSPRRWYQLRKLFTLAQEHGFAQMALENDPGESLEQTYVRAVLLALLDPASLAELDFDRLRFYVLRHSHLAYIRPDISTIARAQAGLLRLSDSVAGARMMTEEQLMADSELILDTRALIEKLQYQMDGIKAGRPPISLGLPAEAKMLDYRVLMKRMYEQWSLPKNRRHERTHFRPLADVVIGFDSVRHFLSHHAFRRRTGEQVNPSQELTNDWAAILDESASGYGLRFSKGNSKAIRIGELLALRSRERSSVHVCITRRAMNRDAKEFDLGVELLCDGGLPSYITTPRTENAPGERVPVLLLPRVARLNNAPALLAPIGKIRRGMSFAVPHNDKPVRLETVAVVEQLASCELIALRPRQSAQLPQPDSA